MNKADWVWMPHAGHLIVGDRCSFHLTTYVNGVIVSTVGEWRLSGDPDQAKFHEIGSDRLYETMVFRAEPAKERCCPWTMQTPSEIDFDAYNNPGAAYEGHMAMCEKWAMTGAEVMA